MINIPIDLKEKYQSFLDVLCQWNRNINLIANTDNQEYIWERHIHDCYRLIDIQQQYLNRKITSPLSIDIGSGGGFPGIILAIALPQTRFYFIESHSKKVAFLHQVCLKLHLKNVVVTHERIEKFHSLHPNITPDFITARALAPLQTLLSYCMPIANQFTYLCFFKGRYHLQDEITNAQKIWQFSYTIIDKPTWQKNDYGPIIMIKDVSKKIKT